MRTVFLSLSLALGAACLPLAAQSSPVTMGFSSGIDGVNDAGNHAYRESGFLFEKIGGSGYFSPVGGEGSHLLLHNDSYYDWSPSFRLRAESGQLFDFIGIGTDSSWGIEGVPVLDLTGSNGQILSGFNAGSFDAPFIGVSWVDFSIHMYREDGPPLRSGLYRQWAHCDHGDS